ncbi:hypothetical protein GYMLUDRAFT_97623 [Collybiopsis luxurians FD-317 M1]|uniref:Zn(2)-C6 fungal-type domain-containing protein n=1 Tax=Collybiopsis luxurians FD-317 M1 TaxID=944289 RepID=A0A0D0CAD8_9AGAR|nr:hypothetical protein GYMLUDRAFT_97623 [Collybiopsis luxurians FD-317 M1]
MPAKHNTGTVFIPYRGDALNKKAKEPSHKPNPPRKRRRPSDLLMGARACDTCYVQKRHCSGGFGHSSEPCVRCVSVGNHCTYKRQQLYRCRPGVDNATVRSELGLSSKRKRTHRSTRTYIEQIGDGSDTEVVQDSYEDQQKLPDTGQNTFVDKQKAPKYSDVRCPLFQRRVLPLPVQQGHVSATDSCPAIAGPQLAPLQTTERRHAHNLPALRSLFPVFTLPPHS